MVLKVDRISVLKRIYREWDKDEDMSIYVSIYICVFVLLATVFLPFPTGFIFKGYDVNVNTWITGILVDFAIIFIIFFLYNSYRMYKKEKVNEAIEGIVVITWSLILGFGLLGIITIFGYLANIYLLKMESSNIGFSIITGGVSSLIFLVITFIVNSILYCRGYYKKTKQILIEEGLALSR